MDLDQDKYSNIRGSVGDHGTSRSSKKPAKRYPTTQFSNEHHTARLEQQVPVAFHLVYVSYCSCLWAALFCTIYITCLNFICKPKYLILLPTSRALFLTNITLSSLIKYFIIIPSSLQLLSFKQISEYKSTQDGGCRLNLLNHLRILCYCCLCLFSLSFIMSQHLNLAHCLHLQTLILLNYPIAFVCFLFFTFDLTPSQLVKNQLIKLR